MARWAVDGSYFLILDKDGLMREVIPQLFSQNSYSSFARQRKLAFPLVHPQADVRHLSVNIYGWRRLQTSPDGKTTNAQCTIWKHDDIYRNCVRKMSCRAPTTLVDDALGYSLTIASRMSSAMPQTRIVGPARQARIPTKSVQRSALGRPLCLLLSHKH